MIIKSNVKNYMVNVEESFDFFNKIYKMKNVFWVVDRNVYNLYEKLFCNISNDSIFILDAVEENKTIEVALNICECLTKLDSKRATTLVSCGGGITQDITGFVANIMYRGIKWTFIPTTLLAACDSCIGGKTSLNYGKFKNLLGTFYPPDEIFICPNFFDTLTEQDYKSGLGEVVKFHVMMGKDFVKKLNNDMEKLLSKDPITVKNYVENCLSFKKSFIEEDEFDLGKRIFLNFAHTFGHAIEVSSNYKIPHGSAIAIGTVVANNISVSRNILKKDMQENILKIIKKIISFEICNTDFDIDKIILAIKKDKKQINSNISAILLDNEFKLSLVNDITREEIKSSVECALNMLKDT